jgi:predicted lipid carrier protein YhbT
VRLASISVPAPIAGLLRRLPESPPAHGVAAALNLALARGVLERSAFGPLAGKRLRIEASDIGAGVTITLRQRGFAAADGPADVVIRARLADYVLLALRREDPDTLFFNRRLAIEGDTELGLVAKNALDAADWDRLPAPLGRLLRFAAAMR